MATFEIPLTPEAQTFRIALAGVSYQLTLLWRETTEGGWTLDIANDGGSPLVQGIPLVTGADLLEPYAYLGFGGQLIVQTDHQVGAVPTYANLGQASHLYFLD
ncbi:MAG: hypothetical protein JWQ97_292 [Phenylobacterium sp.]|nr:hypothetical protein [Phenylobacterium sp.]